MPNTQHRLSHRLGLLAVAVTAALFAWRPAHAQPDQPSSVFGDPILITRAMDGAHSVAAADFDADGDLDVAAVSRLDGQVRWFRNLAETVVPGTSPQLDSRAIDILDGAYALYPADLDNDGDVDLTVAAVTDVAPSATAAGVARDPVGRIVWYENDGGAVPVFARHDVFTTLNYPVSVHAADLDNDGDMDLMSASRDDSKVMWYENDGAPNPSFVPHLLTDRYDGAVSVHAGDLNGDGRQDVVFAAENSDTVAWFANQGGTPATFELHILQTLGGSLPPTQDYAKAVVVADLDGDGDNDVGYVSESQNLLNWYENDGGTMPTFTLHPISDRVLHAKAVYAADVDGDGDTDLLTASTSDQTFALFENDGSDRPEFARRDLITDARGARSVSVADLNGDGRLDILTASRYDNRIQWLPNLSLHRTANFDPADQHVIARGRVGPLVAADVDGDGDQDAATVMDDRLLWYVNDGARAPGFQPSVIVDGLSGVAPADAGDIDGDGDTDLLTVGTGAHALAWYEQGSGGAAAWSRHPLLTTGSARDAFIYDVDRDGDRDIVAALDDRLIWLRHDPTGAVRFEELLIDAARAPDRLLGVDLNRDGQLDIVGSCTACNSVYVYLSDGAPLRSLILQPVLSVDGADGLAVADLGRDGYPDLVVGGRAGTMWIANPGAGGTDIVRLNPAPLPAPVADLRAADLDGDGDQDVVATLPDADAIVWFEQAGGQPPLFYAHTITKLAAGAHHLELADLNGDGRYDLLAAAPAAQVIFWIEETGGHFAATVRTTPSTAIAPGMIDDWLTLTIDHQGRDGAADLALYTLTVELTGADGTPLAPSAVAGALSGLALYRDACCNGTFEPERDRVLARIPSPVPDLDGRVQFELAVPEEDRRIRYGERTHFFVAAELAGTCSEHPAPPHMTAVLTRSSIRDSRNGALAVVRTMGKAADELALHNPVIPRPPLLSELMADNRTTPVGPEASAGFPAWIELHNTSARAVDLSGFYLASDPAVPAMLRLPDGAVVPARGFLLLLDDPGAEAAQMEDGRVRAALPISAEGGYLALSAAADGDYRIVDAVRYGPQGADEAWGRFPAGSEEWRTLTVATPGRVNRLVDRSTETDLLYLPQVQQGVADVDACRE